nr:uncharacterized protein LOC112002055 [Quercus suber]
MASGRKKKNTITRLLDDMGVWREPLLGVAEVVVSYFEKLYTTSHPSRIHEVIDTIESKVFAQMNQDLIKQFTKEEVEVALKQMHLTKSLGPDDGFSSLINKAIRSHTISGLSICRGYPMISHIFFANDNLLFCKISSQECQHLIDILRLYEAAFDQKINSDKSSVFFSANTPEEKKIESLDILGPMQDSRHSKYLGLPSVIGKSKIEVFAEIKERVGRKLSGWKEKILSIGGKEILIKAVAQAIPTYTMSYFQLPKGLCDEIESMMRKFWWGQRGQETKVAWISWKKLCKSKLKGGMGFKNLQVFNLAMLADGARKTSSSITRPYGCP